MNFIFGTAGFAKEVEWLADDIFNATGVDYRADFFVGEDGNESIGNHINSKRVLCETEFFKRYAETDNNCIIAVGSPAIKSKIANKIIASKMPVSFPNLIHPSCIFDKRPGKLVLGVGNIFCANTVLTTDIVVKDFVHINLSSTIGHDSSVGSFTTVSPGVNISGNVHLSERVFVGAGVTIIERMTVCEDAILGMGSSVTKSITQAGTYFGNPARKII